MARSASRRRRTSLSSLRVSVEAGSPPAVGTALDGTAAAIGLKVPPEVGTGVVVEAGRAPGAGPCGHPSCAAGWVAVQARVVVEATVGGAAALEIAVGVVLDTTH